MAETSAINYVLTEDQALIRETAREFLADRAPMAKVRDTMMSADGHDGALWREMADLGWLGLRVPEEHGGAGMGMDDLGVLLEEMGRSLLPGPFFASAVAATSMILRVGTDDQQAEWLPALADGTSIGTIAVWDAARSWTLETSATATKTDGGWLINGAKRGVIYGHVADLLLVVALVEGRPAVFVVESGRGGVEAKQVDALDPTRRLSEIRFHDVEVPDGSRLGPDAGEPGDALHSIVSALANEQLGGAQRCLEMSVEYAKTRHQFGRPIGSYQAIKHRCAEMLVKVEQARSTAYHATRVTDDPGELALAAHLAATICSDAYTWVAGETIQVHGGIGFTWEHDAHLYLKRAKSSSILFGTPGFHRDQLGKLIDI